MFWNVLEQQDYDHITEYLKDGLITLDLFKTSGKTTPLSHGLPMSRCTNCLLKFHISHHLSSALWGLLEWKQLPRICWMVLHEFPKNMFKPKHQRKARATSKLPQFQRYEYIWVDLLDIEQNKLSPLLHPPCLSQLRLAFPNFDGLVPLCLSRQGHKGATSRKIEPVSFLIHIVPGCSSSFTNNTAKSQLKSVWPHQYFLRLSWAFRGERPKDDTTTPRHFAATGRTVCLYMPSQQAAVFSQAASIVGKTLGGPPVHPKSIYFILDAPLIVLIL